ncbi:citrulline utilization hydrolase CtlX [Roseovarius sp.]|uniref:citrulline utilization hydrolase CtlX n=1 Tax=Roseovarius sp. TaxID=1486281 RepID=UPI000C65B84F|nr:arginine deiminase-related protein [Roseovarius sp.]MAZ20428.1 amidinotransferase [Roseovarius sp.]
MMSVQAPSAVVMIRPDRFRPNPQTAGDNVFQTTSDLSDEDTAARAQSEFDAAVTRLRAAGITVHEFQDSGADTPDAVFPNNWFSTHSGGYVALYPMYAENRRAERRWDVIELLKARYRVQEVADFSGLEPDGLFLEGTGAMVIDHISRVAYVARSHRADPILLERVCTRLGYEPIVFDARDASGTPVYHTNVLMAVGTGIALIGDGMIPDAARRAEILDRLAEPGRDVISLSEAQIRAFAGNAIELSTATGPVLALSETARAALTPDQLSRIEAATGLLPLSIPTLERAGGSVRCMLAGVHLAPRTRSKGHVA